jgi:mannan endo-1,4-beta-mannosidase
LIPILLLNAGCNQPENFVTVEGNHFMLMSERYNFLGTNLWYGPLLGMAEKPGNRQRLIRELDDLKSLGITNLRIMGASEATKFDNTVTPAFQTAPSHYNEKVLTGLDFLLAEMGKRNMKAVIYLGNNWIWTGGFAQLVSWATGKENPNLFLPEYNWVDFMNFSARMYDNEEARQIYFNYIAMLINRINTLTGQTYKEDPTIMAWQLANEPRPGEGPQAEQNFLHFSKWVEQSAALIKKLDKNHLVSTGSEGLAGCLQSETLYKEIHQYKNIDYLTAHLWILNWDWYDPKNPDTTFPKALELAQTYLNRHIEFATEIGKPLVIEEFGIPRDNHSYSPGSPTEFRDQYYQKIFEIIYRNAVAQGPMSGSNFWGFGGYGRPKHPHNKDSKWCIDDDFTGDPPQEPQGRNSVFISDESTIKILKNYAEKMNQIK